LFSVVPPTTVVNVCGTAVGDVSMAQELWSPEVDVAGAIDFYSGDTRVVRVEGAAADHLRTQHGEKHTALVAQVTEVVSEHGLVVLRVGSTA
jgi:hypothetical protein